jgi:hypothetical protein
MKITLESTSQIVEINGVPARLWEGKTERGVPIQAFIAKVSVAAHHDSGEMESELKESAPPSAIFRTLHAMQFDD